MSDPISLRNIPPDLLRLAHALSAQTGLSLNAVLRLALASGLLVEATKVTPDEGGRQAGLETTYLAKALRRHLGSAIDLLLEQGQHPYHLATNHEGGQNGVPCPTPEEGAPVEAKVGNEMPFSGSMSEDLEVLGIGLGLAETLGRAHTRE